MECGFLINLIEKQSDDYHPLICNDGQKYFYIDFDNNIPNCTVWDTQVLKNRKLVLSNLLWELRGLFEIYPFVLQDFLIQLKTEYEVRTICFRDLLDYDVYKVGDRKKLLLRYLQERWSVENPEILLCKIIMLKPLKYQENWAPEIPLVDHKETPRSKEIVYVNNVKRKIPKPKYLRKSDALKFNGTTRQHIRSRDDGICQHCGVDTIHTPDIKGHVDHIIPKSKGGPGEPWNGQVLCSTCNAEKHNNGLLAIDRKKLKELKDYYNIDGKLEKIRGRWDYYKDGKVVGRFTRSEIKKMG